MLANFSLSLSGDITVDQVVEFLFEISKLLTHIYHALKVLQMDSSKKVIVVIKNGDQIARFSIKFQVG